MQKLTVSSVPTKMELLDNKSGKVPLSSTMVYTYKDNNFIHFTFDCQYCDPQIVGTQYNEPLWNGDIVEVLLTLGSRNHYLELEVNPINTGYAVLIDNLDGVGDIKITKLDASVFSHNINHFDDRFVVTMSIAFHTLKGLGYDNKNAFINLHRQDFKKDGELELSSLNPNMTAKFHIIQGFIPFEII